MRPSGGSKRNIQRSGNDELLSATKHQRVDSEAAELAETVAAEDELHPAQSPQPLAELGNEGYMPVLGILLTPPNSVFTLPHLRNVCTATRRRFEEHIGSICLRRGPLEDSDRQMLRWHNLTEPIERWTRQPKLLLQPLDQENSFTQQEEALVRAYQGRLLAAARCGAHAIYNWLFLLANLPSVYVIGNPLQPLMMAEPMLARMPIWPSTALNPWDMVRETMVSDSPGILSAYLRYFFCAFRSALQRGNIYKPMDLPQPPNQLVAMVNTLLPLMEQRANAPQSAGSPPLPPLTALHQLSEMSYAFSNGSTEPPAKFPCKIVAMMYRLECLRAEHRKKLPPVYLISRRLADNVIVQNRLQENYPNWNTPQGWWHLLGGLSTHSGCELQKVALLVDDKYAVNPLTTGYPENSLFAAATKTTWLLSGHSFLEQFVFGSASSADELRQAMQLYCAIENCTINDLPTADLLRLLEPYLGRTADLAAVQKYITCKIHFKTSDVRDFIRKLETKLNPLNAQHRAIISWALGLRVGHANAKKTKSTPLGPQSMSWQLNLLHHSELEPATKSAEIAALFESDGFRFYLSDSIPSLELYLRYNAPLSFLMAIFYQACKDRLLPSVKLTELRNNLRDRIRTALANDPTAWQEAIDFCVKNRYITAEGQAELLDL